MTRSIRLCMRLTADEWERYTRAAGVRKLSRFIRHCVECCLERGLTERDLRERKEKVNEARPS